MIGNILKLIGVISVSFFIGYFVGSPGGHSSGGLPSVATTSGSVETERTVTTTTDTTVAGEIRRTTTTVTDTEKKIDRKESVLRETQKEKLRQHRISIAVRPEWHKETKTIRGHPVIGLGFRIMDSPAWAEIGIDLDRKDIMLGVALEW